MLRVLVRKSPIIDIEANTTEQEDIILTRVVEAHRVGRNILQRNIILQDISTGDTGE